MTQHELMRALRAVEQEHGAATAAVSTLLRLAEENPTVLHPLRVERRWLRRCLENLERTYLVRLFTVFEERLREIWSSFGKGTNPKTRDLVNGCASRRAVDADVTREVRGVREFRNSIVHGGSAPIVSLGEARSVLCTFVGWMPVEW